MFFAASLGNTKVLDFDRHEVGTLIKNDFFLSCIQNFSQLGRLEYRSPPFAKGDLGGFSIICFKSPQPPFTKGGVLSLHETLIHEQHFVFRDNLN